jgi:ligand-binding SRPBCC domain-containing protein
MITEGTIEIEAPASVVWDVFTDVEHWSEWTASIQRIVALDGAEIEVGRRFEIKQPRMPKLVWVVTEVEPGLSWTWRQRAPGSTASATHEVTALDGERTVVNQKIDQRGPVGALVGRLTRRMTRRYLDLEAHGLREHSLKARSEQTFSADAAPA